MNKIYAYAHICEIKTLSFSLLLHVSVIAFYVLYVQQKSLEILPAKTVMVEMTMFECQIVPIPKMHQEVIQEPIKPIEPLENKPMVKPKPVVKKEAILPTREEKTSFVDKALPQVPQEAVAQEALPAVTPVQSVPVEPYAKTDFEIIRDKALSHLVYPSIARRLKWKGVVHVALIIDINGKLVSTSIHQSSGHSALDEAALLAVQKLSHEQLPQPKSLSTIILPISFKLS